MQSLADKREARLQRKKQKLAALVTLTQMKDMEKNNNTDIKDNKISNEKDTHLPDNAVDAEPSPKRLCVQNGTTLTETTNSPHLEKPTFDLSVKQRMTDEEFKQFKKLINERRKHFGAIPKFHLREQGEMASLSVDIDSRLPLFLTDIQHLIMYSQLGPLSSYNPSRWCNLEKFSKIRHTNVFIIENLSLYNYESHQSEYKFLSGNFHDKVEILAPKLYNGDSVQEIATVSLTTTQLRKYIGTHGNMIAAADKCPEVFNFMKNIFPQAENPNKCAKGDGKTEKNKDQFPRTDILLSGWQMVEENFPLPIKGLWERKYRGYVLTKDKYDEVTPTSPMYGMDCEMCKTSTGDLELTRVSIVDESMKTIYDELVKPDNPITDYLTRFSGITAAMMRPVKKRIQDVQEDIRKMLPGDAIIVGQSLNNDFHALKMMHPYVIDTSIIFNLTGNRNRKTKLKTLSMEFLSESIQEGSKGHCSTEDSLASLKLARLKLSKDIYFGDAVMSNIQAQIRQPSELGTASYATSMLKQVTRKEKKAFIAAREELALKYCYFTEKKNTVIDNKRMVVKIATSNDDVVEKIVKRTTTDLLIGHVKMPEVDGVEMAAMADGWVSRIWENTETPALNIVVFAGGQDAGNGVCFINMKT